MQTRAIETTKTKAKTRRSVNGGGARVRVSRGRNSIKIAFNLADLCEWLSSPEGNKAVVELAEAMKPEARA